MNIKREAELIAYRVCSRAGRYNCAVTRKEDKNKITYHVQNADLKSFKPEAESLLGVFNAACSYNEIVDLIIWDSERWIKSKESSHS